MELKKLKLNRLTDNSLNNREKNSLRGGSTCTCSCYWADYPGGSSAADNAAANHLGGQYSQHGCNHFFYCPDDGIGIIVGPEPLD